MKIDSRLANAIRARHDAGESVASIHRSYAPRISYAAVYDVVRWRTHKGVKQRRRAAADLRPYAPIDRPRKPRPSKLTPDDVRAIRVKRECGASLAEIAREFNVNKVTIHSVISGRTWRHVQ